MGAALGRRASHVFAQRAQAKEVFGLRGGSAGRDEPGGRQTRSRRAAAGRFGGDAIRLLRQPADRRSRRPQQDAPPTESRRPGAEPGSRMGHSNHRAARSAGRGFLAAAPFRPASRAQGAHKPARERRGVSEANRHEPNGACNHQTVSGGGFAVPSGLVPILPVVFQLRIRGDCQARFRQRRGARRQAPRPLPSVRRSGIRPRSMTPARCGFSERAAPA